MNLTKFAIGLSAGLMTTATGVMAAETNGPAAPPQTHDIRAAELPPIPGWYYSVAYGRRELTETTDNNGDRLFDTTGSQTVYGAAALYVSPKKINGGTLGLYGVATMQDVDVTLSSAFPSDITQNKEPVDLTLGAVWSKAHYRMPDGPPMGPPPGYAYAFGMEAYVPIGDASLGSLVLKPHVAYTYRTDPKLLDGTEFSIRVSYNHVTERKTRSPGVSGHYKDGDYIAADFAITERYKNFQFGLTGTYMKQIQDDKPGSDYTGITQGRMEELALGGVLNIDLGPTSAIKIRYTKGINSKSLTAGNLLGIGYIRKF